MNTIYQLKVLLLVVILSCFIGNSFAGKKDSIAAEGTIINITEYANGYDYKIQTGKGTKVKYYYAFTDTLCHLTFDSCSFKYHRKNHGATFLLETIRTSEPEYLLFFEGRCTDSVNTILPETIVSIWKNDQFMTYIFLDSMASYELNFVDFGNTYKFEFWCNNYVSKHVIIDTRYDKSSSDFEKSTIMEVSLFLYPKHKKIDYGIISETPVAIARINPNEKLNWDFEYVSKRKSEIDKFINSLRD